MRSRARRKQAYFVSNSFNRFNNAVVLDSEDGLRGLGDLYLDTQCTKASLKLRQPPDTYTNDDGVLPPLVAIAQSP